MAKKVVEKDELAYVYVVKNTSYNDKMLAAWDNELFVGCQVVYETKYGLDLGVVIGPAPVGKKRYEPGNPNITGACLNFGSCAGGDSGCEVCAEVNCRANQKVKVSGDVTWLDHIATPAEINKARENASKEDYALEICREKVKKHKLDMKLISAHFLLGEPKVIFFFYSDGRVDFRDLVKDLVSVFKMRIELRQVGDRDEASMLGGLSVCGRDFCCHCFNANGQQIQIKMAKEQDLSLNSSKISGPCGKLLCCLAYEYDYYVEEKANCPPEGSRIKLDRELWRVSTINILSRKITVSGSEGRSVNIPFEYIYFNSDTGHWEVDEEFEEELFSAE